MDQFVLVGSNTASGLWRRTRPFGVPQGSVLGPLLYILYTTELEPVVTRRGMRLRQYGYDSLLNIHVTVSDTAVAEQCLTACVSEVNHWMRASRLRLNPAKTEVMWLGSHQQLKNVDITDIPILSMQVKVSESACDLGVVLDNQLSLSAHVAALCRAGFFHLRQLRPAIQSITTAAARTAVQAFICCRLDDCHSLLYGMSDGLFRKIQSIQNAARLVTGTRRCDHITPVLRHWLPVRRRVDYKVACLVHQSLVTDTDRRPLRSAAVRACFVPRTHSSFGDRSFSAAVPRVWNSLPPHLRQDPNFARFQHKLKTFLFGN